MRGEGRGGGTTKKSQAGKMHRNWVRLQSGFIVHAGQFHSSYVQVHYFLSIQLTVFSSSGSDNDKHSTQLCILRCLLTLSTPCLDLNAWWPCTHRKWGGGKETERAGHNYVLNMSANVLFYMTPSKFLSNASEILVSVVLITTTIKINCFHCKVDKRIQK